MSDKPIPFVVNDRRKFTSEGEVREGVEIAPPSDPPSGREHASEAIAKVVEMPAPSQDPGLETKDAPAGGDGDPVDEAGMAQAPTAEQMEQSKTAFEATAERLETAIRAANPGAQHPPAFSLESLVQSVYMQAVLQLGGAAQEGEPPPPIDLLGARQSIDMLGLLSEKTKGNLSANEDLLLSSAVFELRLAFLEMTQALARSAQQRGPAGSAAGPLNSGAGAYPGPGGRPGPSIVR